MEDLLNLPGGRGSTHNSLFGDVDENVPDVVDEPAPLGEDQAFNLREDLNRKRAKITPRRGVVRGQITRISKQLDEFEKKYPGAEEFTPFQLAALSGLAQRMRPLAQELSDLDEKLDELWDERVFTEDERDTEVELQDSYKSMIVTLIALVHIAEKDKETSILVSINESLRGTVPATVEPPSTSTPGKPDLTRPPPFSYSTYVSGSAVFGRGAMGRGAGSVPVPPTVGGFAPPPVEVPVAPPYVKYSGVKMPELTVPTFDGTSTMWHSFYDRFMGMIDKDPRFSRVHKLDYLKNCLKGDAERILRNVPSTDSNYEVALGMLKLRYEDDWPTMAKHLEALFDFKKLTSSNPKELRRLHEIFLVHTQGLQNLGYPFDNFVMVFLLAAKLDNESRLDWEKEVTNLPRDRFGKLQLPTSTQILNFLNARARTLEHAANFKNGGITAGGAPPAKKATGASAFAASFEEAHPEGIGAVNFVKRLQALENKPGFKKTFKKGQAPGGGGAKAGPGCAICLSPEHKAWNCEKLKEATVPERRTLAAKAKLCFNCLNPGHVVADCKSTFKCKTCKAQHHSLLHDKQPAAKGL